MSYIWRVFPLNIYKHIRFTTALMTMRANGILYSGKEQWNCKYSLCGCAAQKKSDLVFPVLVSVMEAVVFRANGEQ
jgi:hypothetical protein